MARAGLVLLFVAGCGQRSGGPWTYTERIVETPLALDDVSAFGFKPREVLERVPTMTFSGALTTDRGDFGPGSLSDLLLASSPFTVSALTEPQAVFRQVYINERLSEEHVVVTGQITIDSFDGGFEVAGESSLWASGLTDAELGWGGTADDPTGAMPTWVDDAVDAYAEGTTCPGSSPVAILRPHSVLAEPMLLLNIEDPGCASGNYAALDLIYEE